MRPWFTVFALACSSPEPSAITQVELQVKSAPLPVLTEPTEERYAATHVLIAYAGASKAAAHIGRSKEEASLLAREILGKARKGESLESLAREYSDGGTAPRGGGIGVYRTGTMMPSFEAAVASVPVGEIPDVVETPFGFHIVRRDPVIEYRARHIIVSWKGAHNSKAKRPKARARAMIESVLGRLGEGVAFEDLAREVSEDGTAAAGGDLGIIAPGQFVPSFEAALAALQPGEVSDVVETPYGFHIIERLKP
jgi:peptidyl-prolyl cis-trans isomerase SurA